MQVPDIRCSTVCLQSDAAALYWVRTMVHLAQYYQLWLAVGIQSRVSGKGSFIVLLPKILSTARLSTFCIQSMCSATDLQPLLKYSLFWLRAIALNSANWDRMSHMQPRGKAVGTGVHMFFSLWEMSMLTLKESSRLPSTFPCFLGKDHWNLKVAAKEYWLLCCTKYLSNPFCDTLFKDTTLNINWLIQ